MPRTRTLLLAFISILLLGWLYSSGICKKVIAHNASRPSHYEFTSSFSKKVKSKAGEAKLFARQNGYNNSLCFLIDMSLPSGQNRFFVYDMNGDSIKASGLVTHGNCNQWWLEGRKYGNVVGCGCTSLGKYKVGNRYSGRFGKAYKLYGLDRTNDKAFQRYVVLHSHSCVPETEVKDEICQSNGCPTVSVNFLQYLAPIIDKSEKKVLLWIYE
jgi:hypothetical protein